MDDPPEGDSQRLTRQINSFVEAGNDELQRRAVVAVNIIIIIMK